MQLPTVKHVKRDHIEVNYCFYETKPRDLAHLNLIIRFNVKMSEHSPIWSFIFVSLGIRSRSGDDSFLIR